MARSIWQLSTEELYNEQERRSRHVRSLEAQISRKEVLLSAVKQQDYWYYQTKEELNGLERELREAKSALNDIEVEIFSRTNPY